MGDADAVGHFSATEHFGGVSIWSIFVSLPTRESTHSIGGGRFRARFCLTSPLLDTFFDAKRGSGVPLFRLNCGDAIRQVPDVIAQSGDASRQADVAAQTGDAIRQVSDVQAGERGTKAGDPRGTGITGAGGGFPRVNVVLGFLVAAGVVAAGVLAYFVAGVMGYAGVIGTNTGVVEPRVTAYFVAGVSGHAEVGLDTGFVAAGVAGDMTCRVAGVTGHAEVIAANTGVGGDMACRATGVTEYAGIIGVNTEVVAAGVAGDLA